MLLKAKVEETWSSVCGRRRFSFSSPLSPGNELLSLHTYGPWGDHLTCPLRGLCVRYVRITGMFCLQSVLVLLSSSCGSTSFLCVLDCGFLPCYLWNEQVRSKFSFILTVSVSCRVLRGLGFVPVTSTIVVHPNSGNTSTSANVTAKSVHSHSHRWGGYLCAPPVCPSGLENTCHADVWGVWSAMFRLVMKVWLNFVWILITIRS